MNEESTKKIIEVNGVKMEVDLRQARVIEHYKVGQCVRVLAKEYSDSYNVYAGAITGFHQFKDKAAIEIMYVKTDYSGAEIVFKTITDETKDVQINEWNEYELLIKKGDIEDKLTKGILAKEEELKIAKNKLLLFKKLFGKAYDKQLEKLKEK